MPRLFGSCIEDIRIRYLKWVHIPYSFQHFQKILINSRYIVEKVDGYTLCNDNGTTNACATGEHVLDLLKQDANPPLATLAFAYSTTTFLQQLGTLVSFYCTEYVNSICLLCYMQCIGRGIFMRISRRVGYNCETLNFLCAEDRHLFMEDISGLNFMVSHNWQLFMVDADSLVFYNDSRIFAHVRTANPQHRPNPCCKSYRLI